MDEPPPLAERIQHYKDAIQTWLDAGKPQRTDEEVKHIFETYCRPPNKKPCPKYDLSHSICVVCGCKVRGNEPILIELLSHLSKDLPPLANKIRMATEHCPLDKW